VDLDGKVIGINIARAGRTESYAAPTEAVLPLLYDLLSGKLPPKPSSEAAKAISPEQKLAQARTAVERAEAAKTAAESKLAEAKAALEKAEAEAKEAQQSESK
jgi:serine protease Do